MVFGQAQGDGIIITPMALAHLFIPLEAGRRISAETCALSYVFLGSGPYTQCIVTYIPCIISAF